MSDSERVTERDRERAVKIVRDIAEDDSGADMPYDDWVAKKALMLQVIFDQLIADEREECARVAEKSFVPAGFKMGDGTSVYHPLMPGEIAKAIRERGQ